MLPPLIKGEQKACFGVTEPNAGLDTTSIETFARRTNDGYIVRGRKIWTTTAQEADKMLLLTRTAKKEDGKKPTDGMTLFYTTLDRTKVEVRRIPKMGRAAVDSNTVFIDDLFVPDEDRIGEEGRGFRYLLDSLNPERILIGAEAIGLGRDALDRAARLCARPRRVRPADRPEPGHPASAGRSLGLSGKRLVDVPARRVSLRLKAALRRRSQRREIPRRARRVRCLQRKR